MSVLVQHPTAAGEAAQATSLADLAVGEEGTIAAVKGPRAFRRRLLELGLVPGTLVRLLAVAPLGDPLELEARGCRLSIRRAEASAIALAAERKRRHLKVAGQ